MHITSRFFLLLQPNPQEPVTKADKCVQIIWILSYQLKNFIIENIFCVVQTFNLSSEQICSSDLGS